MDSSAKTKHESCCKFDKFGKYGKYGKLLSFAILVARFIASSVALGVLVGLGATVLTLIFYAAQYLAFGSIESAKNTVFLGLPWYRYVLSCTIAMTIAALAWYFLRKKENPPRIVTIPQAVSGSKMPIFSTIAHVLLQIGIVGSGISIGREVAPRELAAMIAQRCSSIFHMSVKTQRMLVASAAGAGLAAVYNAPLAGTVLSLGLLSKTQGFGFYAWLNRENGSVIVNALKNIARSERLHCLPFALVMNYVAAFVVELLLHHSRYYNISQFSCVISWQICVLAVVVGAVCGLVGYVFRLGIIWCRTHALRGMQMLCFMPVAGLVIGVAACWFPHIMGNGRSLCQLAFSVSSFPYMAENSHIMIILLLLALMKMLMTVLVLRYGASGGVLQPSISTGACFGVILYAIFSTTALSQVFDISQVSAISVSIIGAASLLASSRKAPIMAWLLVAELVNAPFTLLCLMLFAVIVSNCVSSCVSNCVKRFTSHSCFAVTRTR
ncbi:MULTISPECIES: chloride channel protein [Gardnerella]|uniref:chloride channel protein n=1 Tax=Gardnerella TaxID=2701 RepID=UPI000353CB1E|nr:MULTISPECIES: chloride channel protein [Gardnerella]EPI54906.1 chloride transporter, ClC family [Gardnerella pickettii JCP7659]NSX26225.1 chloride channel protein [Gardnerella vaginalis]PKZ40327.1 chemotaxis protein [Gardnerella pickettii]